MYHPIEGAQHKKIKNWWIRHKCLYLKYEHVGSKKTAKINTYMLTRAELLITLCYEIPCKWSFSGPSGLQEIGDFLETICLQESHRGRSWKTHLHSLGERLQSESSRQTWFAWWISGIGHSIRICYFVCGSFPTGPTFCSDQQCCRDQVSFIS